MPPALSWLNGLPLSAAVCISFGEPTSEAAATAAAAVCRRRKTTPAPTLTLEAFDEHLRVTAASEASPSCATVWPSARRACDALPPGRPHDLRQSPISAVQ
uniref:Secreted protein n=1 Tax=Macrostomum lignano TaxID=282301 RepID=A0A1I8FGD1_9PLAT